jgi:hypothetical protein
MITLSLSKARAYAQTALQYLGLHRPTVTAKSLRAAEPTSDQFKLLAGQALTLLSTTTAPTEALIKAYRDCRLKLKTAYHQTVQLYDHGAAPQHRFELFAYQELLAHFLLGGEALYRRAFKTDSQRVLQALAHHCTALDWAGKITPTALKTELLKNTLRDLEVYLNPKNLAQLKQAQLAPESQALPQKIAASITAAALSLPMALERYRYVQQLLEIPHSLAKKPEELAQDLHQQRVAEKLQQQTQAGFVSAGAGLGVTVGGLFGAGAGALAGLAVAQVAQHHQDTQAMNRMCAGRKP